MWDFVASSDPFVRFALYSSLAAALATAVLFIGVVGLRLRLIAHRRAEQKFINTWRPLLADIAIRGIDPETAKRLTDIEITDKATANFLLNEWNVLQDCLKGSARTHLIRAAYTIGLDRIAWHMLEHNKSLGEQLLAVVTLGHLGEMGVWDELTKRLDSKNTLLSLMAAKALCNIDPDSAMKLLIERMLSREDWIGARVAAVLVEAGANAISGPLRDAIIAGTPEEQEKLIGFLPMVYRPVASQVIDALLKKEDVDDQVTGACLKVADGPLETPEVRRLTKHPRWHIRMRAASALGRMGTAEDCPLLLELLTDQEWWVRYRAAEALIGMPFLKEVQILKMRDQVEDRYGRDMLDQVLAEAAIA